MAKVDGPLFSMTASGRFGEIVYDKRGHARRFVAPANVKTSAQGNARQILLAAQKGARALGPNARQDVKDYLSALGLPSYRWNAFLVQAIIGSGADAWADAKTQWDGFAQTDKDGWNASANEAGIPPVHISYASDPAIDEGLTLYAVARALDGMGLGPEPPNSGNASDWGDYITQ